MTTERMTKEQRTNARKWIAALRSGTYPQCQRQLNNGEGYCCLGVACEVAMVNGLPVEKKIDLTGYLYDGYGSVPPDSVIEWFGLNSASISMQQLIDMNDRTNKTFSEIADYVESVVGKEAAA